MERQDEKARCLLCSGEPEINIILSTSGTIKAFGLCHGCREYSVSDIIEELCTQDYQSRDIDS